MNVHNMLDLIAAISHEIQVAATAAFVEVTTVKNAVISGMTNIVSLTGLAFLYSSGQKSNNVSSEGLKDCISKNKLY